MRNMDLRDDVHGEVSEAGNQDVSPERRRPFVWLLVGLILLSLYMVRPFFNSIAAAVVFAVLFFPLHKKYRKWLGHRESLASVCSLLSVILMLLVPLGALSAVVVTQFGTILVHFPGDLSRSGLSGLLVHLGQHVKPLIMKIQAMLGTDLSLAVLTQDAVARLGQIVDRYSPSLMLGTVDYLFKFFLMLILLYYAFKDGERLWEYVLRISPLTPDHERKLAGNFQHTVYGILYGNFAAGAMEAVLATIGYLIARIPGALLWGVVTFFVSFVPIVGTAVVIVPLVLYLFVTGHTGYGIFLAVYGTVAIGTMDYYARPLLIRVHINQALVFLSLFGGIAVFGPLGMLLGPIIMALLIGTAKIYEEHYLIK